VTVSECGVYYLCMCLHVVFYVTHDACTCVCVCVCV
jgi:hypothetical protein